MNTPRLSFALSTLSLLATSAFAADWPQWRGPQRTGVSAETGLADKWPTEGPKLVWQAKDVGDGFGSASIVGNRIYLVGNDGLENEFVQAIDATNGKQLWRRRIGNVGEPDQSPNYPCARSTPTVDGDRLYALGSDGDFVCLKIENGEVIWRKNLRTDFNGKCGDWAYAESPLVDGDIVVCTPGGVDAAMVSLNKHTGEVVWKGANPEGENAGYASAIVVNFAGRKQYVQYFSQGLVGVDAASGKFLWRALEVDRDNMATPIEQDGLIYIQQFLASGGVAQLQQSDGSITAKQIYKKRGLPSAIGGTILVNGNLYGTVRDGMVCADFKTGEVKWKAESIGTGAVCSADGLVFVHGEDSDVALVEATPTEYRELGRFKLPEQPKRRTQMEKAWAFPVVANGRLYIRDKNFLWSYDVSDKAASPNPN